MLNLTNGDVRVKINPETGRAAKEAGFGIAVYAGTVKDGVFEGEHCGLVASGNDAERWLAGEDVPRVQVYTDEDRAEARRLMGCE